MEEYAAGDSGTMLPRSLRVVEGGSDFDRGHGRPGGLRCAALEIDGRCGELLRASVEVAEIAGGADVAAEVVGGRRGSLRPQRLIGGP